MEKLIQPNSLLEGLTYKMVSPNYEDSEDPRDYTFRIKVLKKYENGSYLLKEIETGVEFTQTISFLTSYEITQLK